jgi:lysyl-tRNA synthetase, class II
MRSTQICICASLRSFSSRVVWSAVSSGVFEISRNFPNEAAQSPEFAMLEVHDAEVVQESACARTGSHTVTHADGSEFDPGGRWRETTFYGALSAALAKR